MKNILLKSKRKPSGKTNQNTRHVWSFSRHPSAEITPVGFSHLSHRRAKVFGGHGGPERKSWSDKQRHYWLEKLLACSTNPFPAPRSRIWWPSWLYVWRQVSPHLPLRCKIISKVSGVILDCPSHPKCWFRSRRVTRVNQGLFRMQQWELCKKLDKIVFSQVHEATLKAAIKDIVVFHNPGSPLSLSSTVLL